MNSDFIKTYDESELLHQLKQGSEFAFTQIFDHYRSRIYTVALTYLKSSALAEEIVQDVFLKIWLKRTGGWSIYFASMRILLLCQKI